MWWGFLPTSFYLVNLGSLGLMLHTGGTVYDLGELKESLSV